MPSGGTGLLLDLLPSGGAGPPLAAPGGPSSKLSFDRAGLLERKDRLIIPRRRKAVPEDAIVRRLFP